MAKTNIVATLGPSSDSLDTIQLDPMLMQNGCLKRGDTVVFVAGQPIGRPGTTNLITLHSVGELH